MLLEELKYAAWGTGFTFLLTVLGAALVFFFKKDMSTTMHLSLIHIYSSRAFPDPLPL